MRCQFYWALTLTHAFVRIAVAREETRSTSRSASDPVLPRAAASVASLDPEFSPSQPAGVHEAHSPQLVAAQTVHGQERQAADKNLFKARGVCGALFAPKGTCSSSNAEVKWCLTEWERLKSQWALAFSSKRIGWACANVEIGEGAEARPHIQFAASVSSGTGPRSRTWWQRFVHPDIRYGRCCSCGLLTRPSTVCAMCQGSR